MSLIKVENLQKTYVNGELETPVLNGMNFEISEGEFVAIMGPSGSGKSTLLHILGFLDQLTDGSYWFKDKKSTDYSDDQAARIRNDSLGFVFQSFNLLPRASVYENVRLPLLYSRVPQEQWYERITKAVSSVGLTHRSDFDPAQLSGGERQRVAIARSLVMNPDVIFADEPTGNLDTKSGEQVMQILETLNQAGRTIILITHETETARFSQRILHIRDGRIEKDESVPMRRTIGEGIIK
ncbi:MAG: ABC transporter ATP-binding protein [bacterium]|nr:ABC transporter ATP-binding protein [bacterium]